MKYIITENQYKILLREDRVEFLKSQNVIDPKLLDDLTSGKLERKSKKPEGGMEPNKIMVEPIENRGGIDIAYIVTNNKGKQSIKLSDEIFQDIVEADPSRNKEYVQWILNVVINAIKEGHIDESIRIMTEDLAEISGILGVFDRVKNKKIFKRSAPNLPDAPQDVKNINQYKDHLHLWRIVQNYSSISDDDSEENEEGGLWRKLKQFIDIGEAKLVYRDNDVLVYIPLSMESSCTVLPNDHGRPKEHRVNWCTNREGGSYWNSYRQNYPKPDGSRSDMYVIIPKEYFETEKSDGIFPVQIHFESGQVKDYNNSELGNRIFEVNNKYPGVADFFKKELGKLVEMDVTKGTGLMDSAYIKYLNMFGGKAEEVISGEVYQKGVDNIRKLASQQKVPLQQNKYLKWLMENTDNVEILDYLDPNETESLDFSNLNLGKLPNMNKFVKVDRITANNCGLKELPSVNMLPDNGKNINVLSFNDNQIKVAPLDGYQQLKECFMITLLNNPISQINVPVLREMIEDETFIRFGIGADVVKNLSPENGQEFQQLIDEVGGTIQFR